MIATNEQLMVKSVQDTFGAHTGLKQAFEVGTKRPVPAEMFTQVLRDLRSAAAAVTELERRARGGTPPREGVVNDE